MNAGMCGNSRPDSHFPVYFPKVVLSRSQRSILKAPFLSATVEAVED